MKRKGKKAKEQRGWLVYIEGESPGGGVDQRCRKWRDCGRGKSKSAGRRSVKKQSHRQQDQQSPPLVQAQLTVQNRLLSCLNLSSAGSGWKIAAERNMKVVPNVTVFDSETTTLPTRKRELSAFDSSAVRTNTDD
jgi:hypothetical protein